MRTENIKFLSRDLACIYCFICSDWRTLKIVKNTLQSGETSYVDVCVDCELGVAYIPFTCDEMINIRKSLESINVNRKQADDIVRMISSNNNTKYRFNQSFGSVYTEALLDLARKREPPNHPEECPVCLETPKLTTIKTLDCSHIVCTLCFEKMNKERCSICRCFFKWHGDINRLIF